MITTTIIISYFCTITGAAGLLNPALQMDHGLSGLWVFAKLSQVLVEVYPALPE